jgi:hypothetical protein
VFQQILSTVLLTKFRSTPWLTTRRRTCPICKGDVVRSLARGSPPSPRWGVYHDDSDDDVHYQVGEIINGSASAALPIPQESDSPRDRSDLERGVFSPTPSRSRGSITSSSWRDLLTSSLRSASRNPGPQEDRAR